MRLSLQKYELTIKSATDFTDFHRLKEIRVSPCNPWLKTNSYYFTNYISQKELHISAKRGFAKSKC